MSKPKPIKEEKEVAKEKRGYRVQIIVAIIALVGTLGVALLTNVDKLRNTNSNTNQVATANSQANSLQNITTSNSNTNSLLNSYPKTISLEFLQEKLRPIYFEQGKTELSEDNMRILDDYISLINQSDFIIVIEGHIDAEDPDRNMKISSKLAYQVQEYMMNKGINGKKLSVVSFGGERNIKPEKSPYNWRVEFKVMKDWSK